MKKTIIALLTLSGVAFAADFTNDEFGTWYTNAISDTLYQAGDDYTLTFTLGAWPQATDSDAGNVGYRSGMIITLTSAKNWGLFTQAGQYLAFDNSGTNDRGNLVTSSGTYASSNTSEATGSVAKGVEGWFYSLGSTGNQEGVTFTIARANLVDTITITKGAVKIANFTITGDSALDASTYEMPDIYTNNEKSFGFDVKSATFTANGVTRDISTPTPAVPEPTTATLSLLALAGLAARRRRK